MTAIAGIFAPGMEHQLTEMLGCLKHRGSGAALIRAEHGATFGALAQPAQDDALHLDADKLEVQDSAGGIRLARAQATPRGIQLERDPLGAAPLYYGWTGDGLLCFASEVKALLGHIEHVHELAPGSIFDGKELTWTYHLEKKPERNDPPEQIAQELHRRLNQAVQRCAAGGQVGSWLSGGLDSSVITALARPYVDRLHTFAAGFPDAPDLQFARQAAEFLKTDHHEVILNFSEMVAVLPRVIYHLESFDPLLVRSSISNYLVAQRAAEYVPAVFSGEGGDELFAGYEYLKSIQPELLADELIDIIGRLHNTALQRVDRSASAAGTVAHVVFLDPAVVEYALSIPTAYKLHGNVEKWILRRAAVHLLPAPVLDRKKAKFWEGAGVQSTVADYAAQQVSDGDFRKEQTLPNGWQLASKEELYYYRIFKEQFGAIKQLDWMGRTKAVPA